MTKRQTLFASEAQALRRLADALPGRGALTLLGAPLLAVVATFWLQPKAIGSEPSTGASATVVTSGPASGGRERSDLATSTPLPQQGTLERESPLDQESSAGQETSEPFRNVAKAIDAGDLTRARSLLSALSESAVQAPASPAHPATKSHTAPSDTGASAASDTAASDTAASDTAASDTAASDTAASDSEATERLKLAQLHRGYGLVIDCLEHPNNETTAKAFHFYLEEAPDSLRPRLKAACLTPAGTN